MSFAKLALNQPILKSLDKCGYKQPTPIQQQAIPRILAGKDLIATAQTGTGKTAAFVLPSLHYLSVIAKVEKPTLPRVLILTPTRELAYQITDAVKKYGSQLKIKVVSILGGMPYHAQLRQLSQAVDILVATPGRLIDYIERKNIDLSQIRMLILDEADRMLDMGFIEDVKHIAQYVHAAKRQTLLFTATMDQRVTKLAQSILKSPEYISVIEKSVSLTNINQGIYISDDKNHKQRLLDHLLKSENIYKALIFSATKHHADQLAKQLAHQGYKASALHGDMNQPKRNRTIAQFRNGDIQFLVATDVAARGIDISDISHVINFDIPRVVEDYVHRIGRTGRAGREGIAISFVLTTEIMQLQKIERFLNIRIKQLMIAGLEHKQPIQPDNKFRKHHRKNNNRTKEAAAAKFYQHKKKNMRHKKSNENRRKKVN